MTSIPQNRFDRRSLLDACGSLALWPTADPSHLSLPERGLFDAYCQAIYDVFESPDVSVTAIAKKYSVNRTVLYRKAQRCLLRHPDGQLYGYRAVLPYLNVKAYERTAAVARCGGKGGAAGAFAQLMAVHPTIRTAIVKAVRSRKDKMKPGAQVRLPLNEIHRDFLANCRKEGITAEQYPFNTSRLAIRTLGAFMHQIVDQEFSMSVSDAGGKRSRAAPNDEPHAPAATRAFEVVEFDGHKIDLRLTLSNLLRY